MLLQSPTRSVARDYDVKHRIDVEHRPRVTIVRVRGDFDAAAIGTFASVLAVPSAATRRAVVVFDDCRFLDGSALVALVHARERLGRSLRLVDRHGGLLRRILEITGLTFAFDVRSSIGEALLERT